MRGDLSLRGCSVMTGGDNLCVLRFGFNEEKFGVNTVFGTGWFCCASPREVYGNL